MIDKLLKLLVCSVIATVSLSACSVNESNDNLSQTDRDFIKEQIRIELANIPSLDSIANTPVIVSPTISVKTGNPYMAKIIVFCIPFLFTIAILCICLHFKHENMLAKYRIIDSSINKGVQLPDAFYNESKNSGIARRNKAITSGMMWVAMGLSGLIFFIVTNNDVTCALCAIPILVGIVKIISAIIESRSSNSNKESSDAQ